MKGNVKSRKAGKRYIIERVSTPKLTPQQERELLIARGKAQEFAWKLKKELDAKRDRASILIAEARHRELLRSKPKRAPSSKRRRK